MFVCDRRRSTKRARQSVWRSTPNLNTTAPQRRPRATRCALVFRSTCYFCAVSSAPLTWPTPSSAPRLRRAAPDASSAPRTCPTASPASRPRVWPALSSLPRLRDDSPALSELRLLPDLADEVPLLDEPLLEELPLEELLFEELPLEEPPELPPAPPPPLPLPLRAMAVLASMPTATANIKGRIF